MDVEARLLVREAAEERGGGHTTQEQARDATHQVLLYFPLLKKWLVSNLIGRPCWHENARKGSRDLGNTMRKAGRPRKCG